MVFRNDPRHFVTVKLIEPPKTFCLSEEIFLRGGSAIVGGIFSNKGNKYGDSGYLSMHSRWIMQVASSYIVDAALTHL